MSDPEHDVPTDPAELRPDDAASIRPVMDSIAHLEGVISEQERTIHKALHTLRTTVLEQYQHTNTRLDAHAKAIRTIQRKLGMNEPAKDGL